MWRNWNPLTHSGAFCKQQNVLSVPQKVKHSVTIRPSNFTPRDITKRNEKMCPHENLDMDVHDNIIHTSQKVETAHMSVKL